MIEKCCKTQGMADMGLGLLPDIKIVPIDSISTAGTQTRGSIRKDAVEDYAAAILAGEKFDPLVVFRMGDGGGYLLSCGFHRLEAFIQAGHATVPCRVKEGTRWDAILAGIADNFAHRGVRLTRADKRRAAEVVLLERPEMSDGSIAPLVGLSSPTVASVRAELVSTRKILGLAERVGADGVKRPVPKRPNPDNAQALTSAQTATLLPETPPDAIQSPKGTRRPSESSVASRGHTGGRPARGKWWASCREHFGWHEGLRARTKCGCRIIARRGNRKDRASSGTIFSE